MKIIERIPRHYEVEEVGEFGRVYRWCPAKVVAECRGCGTRSTFEESRLVNSIVTCQCGERTSASIREVLLEERMTERAAYPWRYWHTVPGAGIPF